MAGVGFIAAAGWLLSTFPVGRSWLLGLAVVLCVAQWRNERTWLIALPLLIGTVDLGGWSGRFLFSEQDAMFATLVGTAMIAAQYRGSVRQMTRHCFAPLWLITIAALVGTARGLQAPLDLDANALNGYLTSWNAIRIAKGPFWALIFWPLLGRQLEEDSTATGKAMAVGMTTALVAVGAHVLWERGFLLDLVEAKSIRGLFATWLDLSTSYRVTGPFSQMHLGGEAIDAFLLLCMPFAWLVLVQNRRTRTFFLGALAVAIGAYCLLVTFTRTSYAASAIALVAFVFTALSGAPNAYRLRFAIAGLYAAVAAAVFIYGYRLGGTMTIAGYLIVVLLATATGMAQERATARTLALVFMILLFSGIGLSIYGMASSKWSAVTTTTAVTTALTSGLFLAVGGLASGRAMRPLVSERSGAALLTGLAIVLPLATLGFSGQQMERRFASVQQDFFVRKQHWTNVLALMRDDPATIAFGTGVGRLPRTFLFGTSSQIGTWHLGWEDSKPFLRLLGTASLGYGQRLTTLEPGVYRLVIGLRNPSSYPGQLGVKVQPRRLLESERWQPSTQQIDFVVESGTLTWKRLEGELRLHVGSSPPWYDARFPVLVLASHGDPRSTVDIAYVRLIDQSGGDRLDNSDFVAGGDRWVAFNDFEHLQWHAKNFYIALYFDMGAFGLTAFAAAFLCGLAASWQKGKRSLAFGAATAAAIVGFLALGTTGTLLDVPQVMTLMLVIVTAALWRPSASRESRRTPTASEQMRAFD